MDQERELESRLIELESQVAHLARLHEQLNEIVTEQALAADRQRRTIQRLIEQIEELKIKPQQGVDPLDEKPPHY